VAAVALTLAAAVLTTQAPAATKLEPRPLSGLAFAASASVRLHVSTRHALQLHGVMFDAQTSSSDVVAYVFDYGDGVTEASYQPLALHGYRKPGTYHAHVEVIELDGQSAVSAQVMIHVRDGVPPIVRIDSPQPGQRLRRGSQGGLLFTGSAHDSDGVTRVQLAIQLLSPLPHVKLGGDCVWYSGHGGLVLAGCSTPYFFNASRSGGGRWRFRIGSPVTIPPGSYVVRVRAIDRAGNVSHYYALPLRTILPFELTR